MNNSKRKSRFARVERLTLWVGAVCGIVVTGFTIWGQITRPAPPDLYVSFALTGEPRLSVAIKPIKHDVATFPLDLLVTNRGGLTARNVRLKLIDSHIHQPSYNSALIIKSNKSIYSQNSIYIDDSTNIMTTVPLGEIHPGETAFLESFLQVELITNHAPILLSFGQDPNSVTTPLKHHRIRAWISAENVPERNVPLHITVGMFEQLEQEEDCVFTAEDGKLVKAR